VPLFFVSALRRVGKGAKFLLAAGAAILNAALACGRFDQESLIRLRKLFFGSRLR
jgi:hypothetical protein